MNLRHDQTHQCGTSVRRLAAYYRRHKLALLRQRKRLPLPPGTMS